MDPTQLQLWWNFVVSVDAQYGNLPPQTGKGLVVGRLDSSKMDGAPSESLFIVTANHIVRSQDGHSATSITVRLPWSATQPRAAHLTGLYNSASDVAVLAIPMEEKEQLPRLLVVGCRAELQAGSKLRLGDVTAGLSALGGVGMGSFAGGDGRGNLLVSGLPAIEGQSGSPLIDADGAVVAILTSSEGRAGVTVGVPIERLLKMFRAETYLDEKLQPISKAQGDIVSVDSSDEFVCRIKAADCFIQCEKECGPAGGSAAPGKPCSDCQSRSSACRDSKSPRCRLLAATTVENAWSLKWYSFPTCRCVDAGVTAFGEDAITRDNTPFRCSEPGLLGPLQTELPGDMGELPARLAKRFPAAQSDFASFVVEHPPGAMWGLYRKSLREALKTASDKYSDSESLEKRALGSANARIVGLPLCHRIPAIFESDAARVLQRWLDDDSVNIEQVRGGISWCKVQVTGGLEVELNLPLLQLGGKWIFFPNGEEKW